MTFLNQSNIYFHQIKGAQYAVADILFRVVISALELNALIYSARLAVEQMLERAQK